MFKYFFRKDSSYPISNSSLRACSFAFDFSCFEMEDSVTFFKLERMIYSSCIIEDFNISTIMWKYFVSKSCKEGISISETFLMIFLSSSFIILIYIDDAVSKFIDKTLRTGFIFINDLVLGFLNSFIDDHFQFKAVWDNPARTGFS